MPTNRSKSRCYAFRREDNGEIVWVNFVTMMAQDVAGFITLPDGVEARRCVRLEKGGKSPRRQPPQQRAIPMPVLGGEALAFPEQAFAEREAQRVAWGCTDIEFRRDPRCPKFYQVHCASEKAREAYANRRNMVNRTGSLGGGLMLSEEDLERAAELVSRE